MPVDDAVEEIRRGSVTQFDPEVVEAFLALVEEEDILSVRSLAQL